MKLTPILLCVCEFACSPEQLLHASPGPSQNRVSGGSAKTNRGAVSLSPVLCLLLCSFLLRPFWSCQQRQLHRPIRGGGGVTSVFSRMWQVFRQEDRLGRTHV